MVTDTQADKQPNSSSDGQPDVQQKATDAGSIDASSMLTAVLQQAQLKASQGQWRQVITDCEKVIAHCRQQLNVTTTTQAGAPAGAERAEIYQAKGALFEGQGQIDDAIAAYQQAAEQHPDNADLLLKIATLCAEQQQWEKAIAHYHQLLTIEPDIKSNNQSNNKGAPENKTALNGLAKAYLQQAQCLKQAGDLSGAVRLYLSAIEQQPRLFMIYSRLRYNLMRYDLPAGDPLFEDIATACQKIVQKHPKIAAAKLVQGYALTKLGKVNEAIDCFSKLGDAVTRQTITAAAKDQISGQRSGQNGQPPIQLSDSLSTQRHPPDFMIIGAEKCGTTSLYQYLKQHPAVLPTIEKEIDFFDMEYEQGIDWYLSHFPAALSKGASGNPSRITGETSPNYLYDESTPARVFKHFPNIKLAVIVRHPIDRTLSRYSMMVRNGAEKRSFEEAIAQEIALINQATTPDGDIPWSVLNRCRHIGNSLYYYHLKRWLDIFPRQQLLILQSETLFSQPAKTLGQLYERLGISPYPEQTYSKFNVGNYQPIEGEVRQTLSRFFAPHTQKLETLLGQSFSWKAPEL